MGRHDFFSKYAPRPSRLRFAVTRVAVLVLVLIVLGWIGISILLAPPPSTSQLETVPLVLDPSSTPGSPGASGSTNHSDSPGQESEPGNSGAPDTEPQSGEASAQEITVHVVGAVKHPGVYTLAQGARIVDALDAAGGPTKSARPELLNLAAKLTDGQQVVLPDADTGQAAQAAPSTAPTAGVDQPSAGTKISLNSADAQTLQQLPGIGPSLAARIIAFRTANGPFTSVAELDAVSGIGPSIMANLENLVEP